ncbi:hypothetical protein [Ideonella sp. BN130291]|uniref:hypothetical protein n=1 Tax=Ideonella sp. BN130291 TaxID=3112940 RepID=UPI002E266A1E|nr:hypothetical protein [Ideonella sp. BN130291]
MSTTIACSLPGPDLSTRLEVISQLAQRALLSHEQVGRTLRLRYAQSVAGELQALVSSERECCAFLQFDLVRRADAVHLTITAPPEAGQFAAVLTEHFLGQAATPARACGTSCACTAAA